MVGSSKILTVSYGTFSCTLEGFDDSFGTMKAIAEYFRDLAADDRYFGAEPPTPDAEMLARIAEREIARRVEARMDATGIVLRVGNAMSAAEVAAGTAADAARAATEAAAQPTPQPVAEAPAPVTEAPASIATPEPAPQPVAMAEPVAAAAPQSTPEAEVDASTLLAASGGGDDAVAEAPAPTMPPVVLAPAAFQPAAVAPAPKAFVAPPITIPAHPDADSVAAKLQRIRAVVGRSAGLMAAQDESEDNGVTAFTATTATTAAEAFALTEEAPVKKATPTEDNAEDIIEDTHAIGTELDADIAAESATESATAEEMAEEMAEDFAEDFSNDLADDNAETFTKDLTDDSAADLAKTPEADPTPATEAETLANAPAAPMRARVIRMRRADFEQSVAPAAILTAAAAAAATQEDEDGLEDDATADLDDLALLDGLDDDKDSAPAALQPEGTLSPEDEADLMAELAAVERESLATLGQDDDDYEGDDESYFDEDYDADLAAALAEEADASDDFTEEEDIDLAAALAADEDSPALIEEQASAATDTDDDADQTKDETSEAAYAQDAADLAAAMAEQKAVLAEVLDAETEAQTAKKAAPASDAALFDSLAARLAPPDALTEPAAPHAAAPDNTEDAVRAMGLGDPAHDAANDAETAFEDAYDDAETAELDDLDDDFGQDEDEADTPENAFADTDDSDDDTHDNAFAEGDADAAKTGHALLRGEPDADEAAMSRIMTQTDAQLNQPDSSRRREAIAHLKAAVAATEAARRLGDVAPEEDDVENAFRDDLRQVVRPRRAQLPEASSDLRSERPRPAPLKLVASQRVDMPQVRPAPVMPVRPRRVTVGTAPVAPAAPAGRKHVGNFADFAEQMGARELPDLLEAAAAYTSFVEGIEDFSRPQLMQKVRGLTSEDFSREDGLRSFGTLLRQGRIMKVRNGRFMVNEGSRFNPERRVG